jgi:hypothetical protein
MRGPCRAFVIVMAVAPGLAAAVDVKVEYDKTFDFSAVHTWAWNPERPGEVKMARTREDDPEAMRRRVEPVILEAMDAEMARRGLRMDVSAPDLRVTYYLLLTTGASAQTMGQFVPATPAWGLPPFPAATQSFEVMNHGSLVLDMSAGGEVIWRGVAQAKIKVDADDTRRETLIREAVRDLVRRLPKKR